MYYVPFALINASVLILMLTLIKSHNPRTSPPSSHPIPVILFIHIYSGKLLLKIVYIYTTYCYYTNCSNPECYYCLLWITYNNIMIILYHWNSYSLLHTIKLVYRNNHHLDNTC